MVLPRPRGEVVSGGVGVRRWVKSSHVEIPCLKLKQRISFGATALLLGSNPKLGHRARARHKNQFGCQKFGPAVAPRALSPTPEATIAARSRAGVVEPNGDPKSFAKAGAQNKHVPQVAGRRAEIWAHGQDQKTDPEMIVQKLAASGWHRVCRRLWS